ncbi:unnamed protein product, partial [Iphiclides podalirius]
MKNSILRFAYWTIVTLASDRSDRCRLFKAARAGARSSQDQGRVADARQGHLSPPPRAAPRSRANICDRLSSATDMPRSVRQIDLEVILSDLSCMKDELI